MSAFNREPAESRRSAIGPVPDKAQCLKLGVKADCLVLTMKTEKADAIFKEPVAVSDPFADDFDSYCISWSLCFDGSDRGFSLCLLIGTKGRAL